MARSRVRRILAVARRIWIALGVAFFVTLTTWALLAYRASDEARHALRSDEHVRVTEREAYWIFTRASAPSTAVPGLILFPGALVDPRAYAPLARHVAERGHPVALIKVPRRGAFGGADGAVPRDRARAAMRDVAAAGWVVAGHSRGAAIAARMCLQSVADLKGLVLIGSSHPRDFSLAHLMLPVTRVYGTRDTVADVWKVEATRVNLPASARRVRIEGGNHSQFGYYGFQPGDWPAAISREEQQAATLGALLDVLEAEPSRTSMDIFMQPAIAEAEAGLAEGGIPIGSVLVHERRIIGRGHNRRVQRGSAILHAEMDALEDARRQPARVYRDSTPPRCRRARCARAPRCSTAFRGSSSARTRRSWARRRCCALAVWS